MLMIVLEIYYGISLIPVLVILLKKLGEIADDIVAIDQAMKWGFGWELGPFEIWDAIGLEKSIQKIEERMSRSTCLGKGNASERPYVFL